MSVENDQDVITITHIVNPHLFWFKEKNKTDLNVEKLELQLKHYEEGLFEKPTIRSGIELKDELYVAVYLKSKMKWVRAEIDVYDDPSLKADEVIAWITDYGYPLKIPLGSIILLSTDLKQLCRTTESAVIQGGIADVLPLTRITVCSTLFFV